jgi:PKD repeat protein
MNRIVSFFCLVFVLLACQKIEETGFISFKAGFEAPQVVRVGEPIAFLPNESTTGAQKFIWKFGDKQKRTSTEQNPIFAYDTIGKYTALLSVEINKKNGLRKDSVEKTIFALPVTHETSSNLFTQHRTGSEYGVDDIAMSFAPIVGGGFFTATQRDLTNIVIGKLKADLSSNDWIYEFANFGNVPIYPQNIIATSDDGCLVVGYTEFGSGDSDAFVIKLNALGQIEWANFETNSSNYERYTGAVELDNGNFLVVGSIGKTPTSAVVVLHTLNDEGDFVNKSEVSAYKNCHVHQLKKIDSGTNDNYLMVGKYADQPMVMQFYDNFALKALSRLNISGEANAVQVLEGGNIFISGRGYNKGNAAFEDSTSFAFGARFESITGSPPKWFEQTKMYREKYIDCFPLDNNNIICVGEHYNPLSREDVLLTKINARDGNAKGVRLLGDISDHRPIQAHYNSLDGFLYVFCTTREFIADKNSLYDMCILKMKLSEVLP